MLSGGKGGVLVMKFNRILLKKTIALIDISIEKSIKVIFNGKFHFHFNVKQTIN
jgi:hypothetical protein